MSEPSVWSKARRIRATIFITNALDKMSSNERAAISASFNWPIFSTGDSYASHVGRLEDADLAALESTVLSFATHGGSTGTPPAISDGQRSHFLSLAEEALADISEDPDLSESEAARLLGLVGQVAAALRPSPEAPLGSVEMAVTLIVGDLHVHPKTWERNKSKKWFQVVASIVSGLLLAAGAVGGYPGIKELAKDLGFSSNLPVTATQTEQKDKGVEQVRIEDGLDGGEGAVDVEPS